MNASKADKLTPLHTSLVTLLMQILQAHAHATDVNNVAVLEGA
jgi:hypothetical protein